MAEIKVGENLWKEFVTVAKKHRKNPASLAAWVLREYLARAADEDLFEQTEKAARGNGVSIAKAEGAIKARRRKSKP